MAGLSDKIKNETYSLMATSLFQNLYLNSHGLAAAIPVDTPEKYQRIFEVYATSHIAGT